MSVEDSEAVGSVDNDIQLDVNYCNVWYLLIVFHILVILTFQTQLEMIEELIHSEEKIEGDITTVCFISSCSYVCVHTLILQVIHEHKEILEEKPINKTPKRITLKLLRPSIVVASKENAEVEMSRDIENSPEEYTDAGEKANRAKILSQDAYNQIILFKTKYSILFFLIIIRCLI